MKYAHFERNRVQLREMYVPRVYEKLSEHLRPGKVLVISGPRQVGKTTLVRRHLESTQARSLYVTGDDVRMQEAWGSMRLDRLEELIEGYDVVVIDEAQRIPNIGLSLKLLVDAGVHTQLIATGSSSFQLAGQLGEPLTGRKVSLHMYPISQLELRELRSRGEMRARMEEHLIYGSYPEVVTATSMSEKRRVLDEIVGSYLLKDVLELERVKSPKVLLDLLRLIAFQVGSEVSLAELGGQLGLDSKTVARYLDLLEKGYVLFNVRGYSRNLRKEITKKSKYYENALANFETARDLYRKAGLESEWDALVSAVRTDHARKYGFMPGFERIAAGESVDGPSFAERIEVRWARQMGSGGSRAG